MFKKQPFTDETKYSRMDQVKFVEDSLEMFEGVLSALRTAFKFVLLKENSNTYVFL